MILNRSIKTVLFDVDGTLIDSNHQHTVAWQHSLEGFGYDIPYAHIRAKIGMGGDHLLPALTGLSAESPKGRAISRRRGEIFHSHFLPQLKAFPGTRELLRLLRDRGFQLVIATSSTREDLCALLQQCALEEFFPVTANASDAEASKPNPEIVLTALWKSGTIAGQAVMVGDTPYDLAAAARANVKAIGFTCGGWDEFALQDAAEIYPGPSALHEALRLNWTVNVAA